MLYCFCTFGITSYLYSLGIKGRVSSLQNLSFSSYTSGYDIVTRCPTHQVTIQLSDSKYPSFLCPFILSTFANSIATEGFSVISNFLVISYHRSYFIIFCFLSRKYVCFKFTTYILPSFYSNKIISISEVNSLFPYGYTMYSSWFGPRKYAPALSILYISLAKSLTKTVLYPILCKFSAS